MKVRWSPRALAQLEAAHGWIARDNPIAAREFVDAATSLADLLGMFPEMGVRTDEVGVTMFPLQRYRYRIFYRVFPDEVRIIRLRHTSRRPKPR